MYSPGARYGATPRHRASVVVDPATGDQASEVILFASDTLSIADRIQTGPKRGWGPPRGGGAPSILFLRAGLFECRTTRESLVTDTTYVKCYDAKHEYHLRRLEDGGEAYTLFRPGRELMEEAFGDAGYQAACANDIHFRHLAFYRALLDSSLDTLAANEAAMGLLAQAAKAFGTCRGMTPPGPAVRRRLQAAQAYVAADPAQDHRLSEVARIAGCSEFHFARLFRAETGQSLRSYRKRLRLRLALRLISEGQDDLTSVALDAGFSTHSHMTASFQAEMGRTPSAARERIAPDRH
jgi:AraC-like DNA-binding protein